MKFTKEDANKELVARMTAKGERLSLSERTINEHLDTLMPFVGEDMELEDFIEKTLPLFQSTNSNIRNDVSAGIKAYKDSNPIEPTKTQTQTTAQPTDQLSDLMRRVEELENEKARMGREKKIGEIKEDLIAKLKGKGIKDNEWIQGLLSEVTITEDVDIDAKVESYLGLYNKMNAITDPVNPPSEPSGGKSQLIDAALQEAVEIAKARY